MNIRRDLFGAALLAVCLLLLAPAVRAQAAVDSQSNGEDGAFSPSSNITIDLGQAAELDGGGSPIAWDSTYRPAGGVGKGVYDRGKWAVVFHYTSVNIPAGVTVKFKNHPSRAPVVWLVQGNVTIDGVVSLNGASSLDGSGPGEPEPGPGGFRGGRGGSYAAQSSAGFGPGGGRWNGSDRSGSYATITPGQNNAGTEYGNEQIVPLLGGSGMARQTEARPGTAGGGAILIAAGTASGPATVTINGRVEALSGATPAGGYLTGSGGAIRVISSSIAGSGALRALPFVFGGMGRIRVEVNTGTISDSLPQYSSALPGAVAALWPAPSQPAIKVVSVDGNLVGPDPRARFELPARDIGIQNPLSVVVRLEAWNVPVDNTWTVRLRAVPDVGTDTTVSASVEPGGSLAHSFWTATLPSLPNGFAALQARAVRN